MLCIKQLVSILLLSETLSRYLLSVLFQSSQKENNLSKNSSGVASVHGRRCTPGDTEKRIEYSVGIVVFYTHW